jgi:hypothetical protein
MPEGAPPVPIAKAAIAARRALLWLADRMLPRHLALFDKTIGIGRTHVLGTIAELGVADLLAEQPATAAELAARLGVNEDSLHRLLRAAATEGLVRLDRHGRFSLARLGEPLRSDAPDSIRSWSRYMAFRSTASAWAELTNATRAGETAFSRVHGMSVWDWFAEHPEEERVFAAAMRRLTEDDAPGVVAAYPWPETGVVCDVAGGVGTLLAAVLRAKPGLRGILVDGPGVLSEAEPWLADQGLRERVELVSGDIFESVEARADVYLLKDVLHDWDDERCLRILKTVEATMPPGSRLLLVELLQEPNVPHPFASLEDIQMLTQCEGGRQRSAGELGKLVEAAGMRFGTVRETPGPAVVEAFSRRQAAA